MDHDRLLQIIQAMLVGFKLEIAKMRSEGATQAEIDFMLDEFEEVYAPGSQTSCSVPELAAISFNCVEKDEAPVL